LQIDDLDDEVFENLNAEDIFETAEPTQSIDTNESAVEDVSTYITEAVKQRKKTSATMIMSKPSRPLWPAF